MKRKIVLYNALDMLLAVVVPIIFIVIRYDLFAYKEKYSITGWGILIILLVLFVVVRRVMLWLKVSNDVGIRNMPLSYFLPPFVLFLFFAFLKVAENHMDTLLELTLWSGVSNTFALFFRWRAWKLIDESTQDKSSSILDAIKQLEKKVSTNGGK